VQTLGGFASGRSVKRGLIAALLAACTWAVPATASADTFTPTTTTDGSNGACTPALCTLRDAIAAANLTTGNAVSIPPGHYTLSLGELGVGRDMTITGAGPRTTVVDAQGTSRVFDFSGDFEATLRDVGITGGNASATSPSPAGDGGGILNLANTLHLHRIALTGNTATFGGGGLIAPFESGPVGPVTTIDDSLIAGNTVTGGLVDGQGGGLAVFGDTTITNSTITGNRVSNTGINQGGGIMSAKDAGATDPADLTLLNTTVAGNTIQGVLPSGLTPNFGGGIAGSSLGTTPALTNLTAKNSIVSGNIVDGAPQDCGLVAAASTDHNLSSDSTCLFTDGGSLQNANPLLGPLHDNGGPTDTLALLDKSPATNAGTNAGCPATDQRGTSRPQGPTCDIGAYERVLATDLVLTQAAKARVKRGKPVKYRLTISNRGELTAPGIELADRLPAKTFKARPPSGCKVAGKKRKKGKKGSKRRKRKLRGLNCALGDLAPGASTTLLLKIRSAKRKGALTNQASVTSQLTNSNPAGASSSATVRIRKPKKR
jgi:CSLREA domain-containing protein/uncharacterized repeat protein (TIGR01451 family)